MGTSALRRCGCILTDPKLIQTFKLFYLFHFDYPFPSLTFVFPSLDRFSSLTLAFPLLIRFPLLVRSPLLLSLFPLLLLLIPFFPSTITLLLNLIILPLEIISTLLIC